MENKKIQKTTLHPVGDDSVDLYPKTSTDQIVDLVNFLNKQGLTGKPFEVGEVTTLPANHNAEVTFTETADKVAINFAIPRGDMGAPGNPGPEGREGPVGPRGPSGNDFQIKLQVDNVSDLPTASAAYLGWAAFVGTETPRNVYACVEITEGVIAWENQGRLEGIKGADGNGVSGFTLVKHEVVGNETYNTIQANYTESSSNTFEIHVQNGRDGANGTNGTNGRDGTNGSRIYVSFNNPTSEQQYNQGDIWINNTNWDVFDFDTESNNWIPTGNIKGEPPKRIMFNVSVTSNQYTRSITNIAKADDVSSGPATIQIARYVFNELKTILINNKNYKFDATPVNIMCTNVMPINGEFGCNIPILDVSRMYVKGVITTVVFNTNNIFQIKGYIDE